MQNIMLIAPNFGDHFGAEKKSGFKAWVHKKKTTGASKIILAILRGLGRIKNDAKKRMVVATSAQ